MLCHKRATTVKSLFCLHHNYRVAQIGYVMRKSDNHIITIGRVPKDALIRARCSVTLRNRLARIAVLREVDLSDVLRDACNNYATQFDQRMSA